MDKSFCQIILIVMIVGSLGVPAFAASNWTLTTGDLHREAITLQKLDRAGITIKSRLIPWSDIVSIEKTPLPPKPAAAITLQLKDGARLVGAPAALGETSIQWHEPLLGDLSAPIAQVRSIDRSSTLPPPAPGPTDRIQFTNGDNASGIIANITADSVSIKTDTGTNAVPMSAISRITFASLGTAKPAKPAGNIQLQLTLNDGSIVDASNAITQNDSLKFSIHGSAKTITLPLNSIDEIDQLNGPVAWLSSRMPAEQTYQPYYPFAPAWPAQFGTEPNAPADGSPHVIRCHARSILRFDIQPGWSRFHAEYQLQPTNPVTPAWADVTVRVLLGDKVAFEKRNVRANSPNGTIDIPLNGARSVTLETDFGQSVGAQSAIDWINPALLKAPAAKVPSTNKHE